MAATTWHPRTQMLPKRWLLTSGEVVQEPALEETASGRKVRIAGTEVTAFSGAVDDLIWQAVQATATAKGAEVWMELDPAKQKQYTAGMLGYDTDSQPKAELGFTCGKDQTIAWWIFKHPIFPIEATVSLVLSGAVGRLYLQPRLVTQSTYCRREPTWHVETNRLGEMIPHQTGTYSHNDDWREFLRDNPPAWEPDKVLGQEHFQTERAGVKELLARVRHLDSLLSIEILDLRDLSTPSLLELKLWDTNVTEGFINDLTDYLDGEPAIALAATHYRAMVSALRQAGLVLGERNEGHFQAALAGGGEALTVEVKSPADEGGDPDPFHSLTLHLITGTIIVNCSNRHEDRDRVAEKWDEAVALASLTGKSDELLAYARRYAETQNEARKARILTERGADNSAA